MSVVLTTKRRSISTPVRRAIPPMVHPAREHANDLALSESVVGVRPRYTRENYHNLVSIGFLSEDDRYELIEGQVIAKMPQKRKHLVGIGLVQRHLVRIFSIEQVQTQGPIAADNYNEPEPDVAVLRQAIEDYLEEPTPEDVLLLVEVSNTTQATDRTTKANMYARVGIGEYWILDVRERTLRVYRPMEAGGYGKPMVLTEADSIAPLAAPDAPIAVADMLPPASMRDDPEADETSEEGVAVE